MINRLKIVAAGVILVVGIASCYSILPPQTRALYKNLRKVSDKGFMFGHQDATVYGIGWEGDSARSDVKSVCGDYPAVCGWDLGRIEFGGEKSLDKVPFEKIRKEIVAQYLRGGLNTVSWHVNNPLTGGDAWDVKNDSVVTSILPGGAKHELFLTWLDKLAVFFNSLTTANGKKVPVLFRPWHEHTGNWFWWGKSHCTPEQYKALWKMTHDYLHSRGVNNLLYAYSPGDVSIKEEYTERYPGDKYVDLLGFDCYQFNGEQGVDGYISTMNRMLTYLTQLGKEHKKPIAVTETGLEALTMNKWWTEVLFKILDKYPVTYVLVWRNARERPNHFYAPYPGQSSSVDFIQFYNNKKTLFSRDIKSLYK